MDPFFSGDFLRFSPEVPGPEEFSDVPDRFHAAILKKIRPAIP
jgi:hypothetical protein